MVWNPFRNFKLPRPTGQGLRTAALFMGAPIFGGVLVWQLMDLNPDRVCKIVRVSEESCLQLLGQIYGIKDHAIIGLMAILGLGYLMMMMRELRMQGELSGPLGIGGKFRTDDGTPIVTTTTETKVEPPKGGE